MSLVDIESSKGMYLTGRPDTRRVVQPIEISPEQLVAQQAEHFSILLNQIENTGTCDFASQLKTANEFFEMEESNRDGHPDQQLVRSLQTHVGIFNLNQLIKAHTSPEALAKRQQL